MSKVKIQAVSNRASDSAPRRSLLELRLSQNPVFSTLSGSLRQKITEGAVLRSYERSSIVARELEQSQQFLLILEGAVEICRYTDKGRKFIFRTLYPPSGVGYLLLSGQPHTADVVAAGQGALIALISIGLLKDIFNRSPEALYKVIAQLSGLVDELSSESLEERNLPLMEQVRRSIYRNANEQGELRMSHEEIAQCVGATRANVSRALKKLSASGILSLGRRSIRIRTDFWCSGAQSS